MGGNSFEHIAQQLLQQKRRMEELEQENYEFRRQISELREGRGIFLDINGHRYALTALSSNRGAAAYTPIPPTSSPPSNSPSVPISSTPQPATRQEKEQIHQFEEPVTPPPTLTTQPLQPSGPLAKEMHTSRPKEQTRPPFLEEVLLDEFAHAATSPLSVWQGPVNQPHKKSAQTAEEQKAALRRELMGSFLLE